MTVVGVQYAPTDLKQAKRSRSGMRYRLGGSMERPSRCSTGAFPISNLPFSHTFLLLVPAFPCLPLPGMAFPATDTTVDQVSLDDR